MGRRQLMADQHVLKPFRENRIHPPEENPTEKTGRFLGRKSLVVLEKYRLLTLTFDNTCGQLYHKLSD